MNNYTIIREMDTEDTCPIDRNARRSSDEGDPNLVGVLFYKINQFSGYFRYYCTVNTNSKFRLDLFVYTFVHRTINIQMKHTMLNSNFIGVLPAHLSRNNTKCSLSLFQLRCKFRRRRRKKRPNVTSFNMKNKSYTRHPNRVQFHF